MALIQQMVKDQNTTDVGKWYGNGMEIQHHQLEI
jgi:hypothetical protein